MKIARTARPRGYSGMTEVTVRGSLIPIAFPGLPVLMQGLGIGKTEQAIDTTQYEPGLSEEVGILPVKSNVTPSTVGADEDIVPPPLPHVPASRKTFNVPAAGGDSQPSVPVTVMLGVPCVMVDEERTAVKGHVAYAGERTVAPTIVSTRIESTATPMNLNV
jgi:hypothetical protein